MRAGRLAVRAWPGEVDLDDPRVAVAPLAPYEGDALPRRQVDRGLARPVGARDPSTRTISLTYVVEEAPRIYIERINVRGNSRTRDDSLGATSTTVSPAASGAGTAVAGALSTCSRRTFTRTCPDDSTAPPRRPIESSTPLTPTGTVTAELEKAVTIDQINDAFRAAAAGNMKGILAVSDEPLVSVDYIGNPASSIMFFTARDMVSTLPANVPSGSRAVRPTSWWS